MRKGGKGNGRRNESGSGVNDRKQHDEDERNT